ncbi:outer membrane phospholipase A [Novosphingobium sp. PhB165]|uniref:phospholipase A n=1 Tax=Novosphingobium sp. PhB165 TaxID=2485105 RepID=UPI00104BC3D5|nr:phospholipase A [Novosphingobium sp. PhB165]TCM15702.1 outer membrane phospholipase A [Novosphingobium sp. PhB165]
MTDRLAARRILARCLPGAALLMPLSAHAEEPVETLIGSVSSAEADGTVPVELRFLNPGAAPATVALPDRVAANVESAGRQDTVWLERAPGTPASLSLAPGGFAKARYRLAAGTVADGALLSIPQWRTAEVALHSTSAARMAEASPPPSAHTATLPPAPTPTAPADRSYGNAFIDNLGPYEPIYAVFGPGTDTEARLQISFDYHLFGSHERKDLPTSWRGGLHFTYTQRMFWDLRAQSMPFHNIDYQPELIYVSPAKVLDNGMSLALQGGLRHESNGRDGEDSRSVNTFYVAPMAAIPLGGDWRLLVAPKLAFYLGDTSDNPDIIHYRGHTGLFLQIGDPDGLRIATNTRFNFGSGKGAINTEVSYPLPRLLGGGPDFYLFAQAFAGYGENLLDYNKSTTRLRVGFALVR